MLSPSRPYPASGLADRGLQKMQTAGVERSHGRIVHLVVRHLEHLVFEIDGVAGGPRLEADLAVLLETFDAARGRDMITAGTHHRQRSDRSRRTGAVEFRFDQIA